MINIYEKDLAKNEDPRYEGDPQLYFHEFELLLCRVAMDTYPKELATEKRDFEKPLYRFFSEILSIRKNEEINVRTLPSINRRFFAILEASYNLNNDNNNKKINKSGVLKQVSFKEKNNEHTNYEDDFVDPRKLLQEYTVKSQFEKGLATIDYLETYKMLDRELPPLHDPIKM